MSEETEVARAIVTLAEMVAKEPPIVEAVVKLTPEEACERHKQHCRRYYERNRDTVMGRFKRNGANKRYYQRNRGLKMDMVTTNVLFACKGCAPTILSGIWRRTRNH